MTDEPTPQEHEQPSLAYQVLKAKMDAWELWEEMAPRDKLALILDTFAAESWSEPSNLNVLAVFYQDASEWMRIKARGKAIGVNVYDLERAVKDILKRHGEAQHSAQNGVVVSPPQDHQPDMVTLSAVEAEETEWLWWPYLPIGGLAMLDGEPGVGKSLLSLALAAILSRGWPLPNQQGGLTLSIGAPGGTLLMNAEDSLASTIRPRLDAVGADCARITALTGWHNAEDTPGEQRMFTLEHIPVLEQALRQCHPRLVIIDPIQAYLGAKVDINRANETHPLLALLGKIAERHRCVIVLVRHPAKGGQGLAIHRGLGSIDFIGTARTALFVAQHPTNSNAALVCQTKTNIGIYGRTQIFSKERGEFQWSGVSRITAEMLAGGGRGPDPTAFHEAFFWLEQRLEGGLSWPTDDIMAEGEEQSHSKKMLYKAKKALGVINTQHQGHWTCRLSPLSLISQEIREREKESSTTTLPGALGGIGGTGETGRSDLDIDGDRNSQIFDMNGEALHPLSPVYPDTPLHPVSPIALRASDENDHINESYGEPPSEEEVTL